MRESDMTFVDLLWQKYTSLYLLTEQRKKKLGAFYIIIRIVIGIIVEFWLYMILLDSVSRIS